jgi:hypothetical protein
MIYILWKHIRNNTTVIPVAPSDRCRFDSLHNWTSNCFKIFVLTSQDLESMSIFMNLFQPWSKLFLLLLGNLQIYWEIRFYLQQYNQLNTNFGLVRQILNSALQFASQWYWHLLTKMKYKKIL